MQIRSGVALNRAVKTRPYQAYNLHNYRQIPQVQKLSEAQQLDIETVAQVLPFKTNNYVIEELIDWDRVPEDPLFLLNFPQRGMLLPHHYTEINTLMRRGAPQAEVAACANRIRYELNPHPDGQLSHNQPVLDGETLRGMQHKYRETVLFFPSHGQTCHAYCVFCFRWPQFVGIDELKFAMRDIEMLIQYLSQRPTVTDVLFTGGDPLIMNAATLASYLTPLLEADLPNFQTIRIGSKALSYWPYRFLTDPDADDLLRLFEKVTAAGKHLALMAHINHPRELQTEAARHAIARIRSTGALIRTQSPLLAHINDQPELWSEMWQEQVHLGCNPYYMFIVRDTGAQHYFGVPLVRAWEIYRQAYRTVSGLGRTVRGPVMSAHPGKVHLLGVETLGGEQVLLLQMLQGRNPEWVLKTFFARYDEQALWLDQLRPAFGEDKFFFDL